MPRCAAVAVGLALVVVLSAPRGGACERLPGAVAAAAAPDRPPRRRTPARARRRRIASAAAAWLLGGAPRGGATVSQPPPLSFEAIDEDGNGFVDKGEWMYNVRDTLNSQGKENKDFRRSVFHFVEQLYDMCDIDRDGVLNKLEFDYSKLVAVEEAKAARQAGRPFGRIDLSKGRAEKLHRAMDKDGSGGVDLSELIQSVAVGVAKLSALHRHFEDPPLAAWARDAFEAAEARDSGALASPQLHFAMFLLNRRILHELEGAIMRDLDRDRDGILDRQEVVAGFAKQDGCSLDLKRHLLSAFDTLDGDGDGRLDPKEMELVLSFLLGQTLHQ